jgi:hypothetical protein
MNDISSRINEKIEEDYLFNFQTYLLNFQKTDCFDFLDEITQITERIVFNEFSLILDAYENIIFTNNTHKNLSEYIFEILQKKDKPLTVPEIYAIINTKHPNVTKSEQALRGSLQRDDRIMHFGRNSTYGLKIWEQKENIKGGTMHDISEEYLNQHLVPIHIDELVNYVSKYRKNVTQKNLLYNLKSVSNKRFYFFKKGFVGSVKQHYDNTWIRLENIKKKTWDELYLELLEFCKKNKRLPNTSVKSNENKMYRFFYKQNKKIDSIDKNKKEKIEYIKINFPKIKKTKF